MNGLDSATAAAQYLSFYAAGEEFALGILQVREIVEYGTLTQVPTMPAAVRGVINLRGRVVPVIDLGPRFGLAGSPITNRSCIVVVETTIAGEPAVVGILAGAVHEVLAIADEEIEPPPSFGTAVRPDFLRGLARSGQKFVMILDLSRIVDLELEPESSPGLDGDPPSHGAARLALTGA